ncbi:ribokinase [Sedimentitalea sp. JM2-8]|uniref:Ribokinase n=1 Tax=Sedimentitalea xiamensis TaxID=3050037 RepID=A0ABT7FFB2_9RHOB|nr:ribokinase [Sedimentitalea xiamensis]MDK3073740.1 ribokinase [Sedimentitalea xiamensis]
MGKVVVLGIFVADAAFRADRMPRMGETVLGNGFLLGPGGKGSNQAVAAARIGAETHFLTRLGQDAFADMARGVWEKAGVIAHVRTDPDSHTGAAFIYVDDATGDNAIIVSPGAAERISPADVEAHAALIAGADVFMAQLEHPVAATVAALRIARTAGVATILNPAPAADLPPEVLALCDYLTPNETEAEALTGLAVTSVAGAERAAARLCEMGVGTPIITLGERGAYLHGHGLVPSFKPGSVVETTGAGDAFNGGFAAALSRGAEPLEAVRIGCATAGLSVTRRGAAASMPALAEVEKLIG